MEMSYNKEYNLLQYFDNTKNVLYLNFTVKFSMIH
jgi:hypothetical protein